MKTLSSLNTKPWYRILKVFYVLVLIATVAIIYTSFRSQYDSVPDDIIVPLFWVLFILEIFKRSIYYVYAGTIFPVKMEVSTYISAMKDILKKIQSGTEEFPDTTKDFLSNVSRVAQIHIDEFEKKDGKKNTDNLSKVYQLVVEANNLYRPSSSGFTAMNAIKIRSLYYALELGMDIDTVKIEL